MILGAAENILWICSDSHLFDEKSS